MAIQVAIGHSSRWCRGGCGDQVSGSQEDGAEWLPAEPTGGCPAPGGYTAPTPPSAASGTPAPAASAPPPTADPPPARVQ